MFRTRKAPGIFKVQFSPCFIVFELHAGRTDNYQAGQFAVSIEVIALKFGLRKLKNIQSHFNDLSSRQGNGRLGLVN